MAMRARAPPEGVLSAAGAPAPEKDVADFLSRVVPWPQPDAPGFINVHWTFPSHGGMGGKPFTQLADALSFIEAAKRGRLSPRRQQAAFQKNRLAPAGAGR